MQKKASSKSRASSPKTKSKKSAGGSSAGRSIFDEVLSISGTLFRHQKESGAQTISSVAAAMQKFGAEIPDLPAVRTYTDAAAAHLRDFAGYVGRTSFEKIGQDASGFARRNPMIAVGLGLLVVLASAQAAGVPMPSLGKRGRAAKASAKSAGRRRSAGKNKASSSRAGANGNGHAASPN